MRADYLGNDTRRGNAVLFPIALVGATVLILIGITLFFLRDGDNAGAAERETVAVRAVMSSEVESLGTQLMIYSRKLVDSPPSDPAILPARLNGPFNRLYLIDLTAGTAASNLSADDQAAIGTLAGPVNALASERRDSIRGTLASNSERNVPLRLLGQGNIVAINQAGWTGYVLPFIDNSSGHSSHNLALAAFQQLDDGFLARLARKANVARVDIEDATSASGTMTGIALATAGSAPAALVWKPERPGDALFEQIGALLIAFSTLFVALIVFHAKRVMRELVDRAAEAKMAAGQDLLTGLPNRLRFHQMLDNEVGRIGRTSTSRGLALLYLDLDRFKEVNDTYGHAAGDALIVQVCERINSLLRNGATLARLGGDEFAVLQCEVSGPSDVATLARRILEVLADPINIGSSQIFTSMSIGIALCPHDAATPLELTRLADLALYRAKNDGRNRFCFFENRMGEALRMRRTVEDDLRLAIDQNQLIMHYQPVMDIDGKTMVGVEALVRWQHPVQGMIPPGDFITLAEECGLILELGTWVLRRALYDVRGWPGLRVAVNVSAIQFRQKDFVGIVQKLLDETGVEPTSLELELTESVLLADADQAEDAMMDLRAMGVRLALDDFGTGYSSLIYLRRFAFDKIKIDRSFLESMEATGESSIIVHSIVHLGRALGLTVTAEGVETRDQHMFLQALGCHELQGYLFSQGVEAAAIDAMLAAEPEAERSVA